MKQGKYISGDERGGFKVDKVTFPLTNARLRLFIQGKKYWLEEGLHVPVKKNKRGMIIEEGSSAAQEGGAQPNYAQAWGSGGAMPPPNFAVPNEAFAEPYAHFLQPQ
jgi:hypothetical protein